MPSAFDLIGADAGQRGVAGHIEIIVEKAVGKVAHGQSRRVEQSNSTVPSRTSASAELSTCVLAAQGAQLRGGLGAVCGLLKRVSPRARVWSAPSTSRPGTVARHGLRLGARQQPRRSGGIVRAGFRFHRAFIDMRRADLEAQTAAASILPRTSLFDASTSGCGRAKAA